MPTREETVFERRTQKDTLMRDSLIRPMGEIQYSVQDKRDLNYKSSDQNSKTRITSKTRKKIQT